MCINYLHVWAVLLLAGRFVDARLVDPEYDHLAEGMELSRHIRQGPDDPNPPGQGGNPHRDPGESCDRFTYYADAKGNIQIGDSQCVLPVCSIKGFDTKDDAWVQIGDKCYLYSGGDKLTPVHAQKVCELLGANLTSFETEEELNNVMANEVYEGYVHAYGYIVSANKLSGTWKWGTGAPLGSFINWYGGEDGTKVGYDYMAMRQLRSGTDLYRATQIRETNCEYRYVCEYP